MKSLVTKRSIVVGGHKTSVSLEEAFWKGLKEDRVKPQCHLIRAGQLH
jgi:predicted DNA-binding ribbon-helix-helix protein